jgi:23S rRNA pseudouridine2605 synthase
MKNKTAYFERPAEDDVSDLPAKTGRGGAGERLHKKLAEAGAGSRREMETAIAAGQVSVNGKIAEVGARCQRGDRVRVQGHEIRLNWDVKEQMARVLLYHKPEGEIVSRDDPGGRISVFDQLPRLRGQRWVAVGRLDVNTEGLLIFTTSGELANHMMHPRYSMDREYAVRVLGGLTPAQIQQLLAGIELDDGVAKATGVVIASGDEEAANQWYRLTLSEGRNREVRRLIEALGLTVSRLIRVRFGPVSLPPRLRRGQYMELDERAAAQLVEACGLAKPGAPRPLKRSRAQARRPG